MMEVLIDIAHTEGFLIVFGFPLSRNVFECSTLNFVSEHCRVAYTTNKVDCTGFFIRLVVLLFSRDVYM